MPKENKSTQKYGACSVLDSWVYDLLWSAVETPSDTTLEKLIFAQKGSVVNSLLVRCGTWGSSSHSPHWDFVWFTLLKVLHLLSESLSSHVFWPCCVWKVMFPWSHLCLLQSIKSFRKKSPWIWIGNRNMGDFEGRK